MRALVELLRGRVWAPLGVALLAGQALGLWLPVWWPALLVLGVAGLTLALRRRGRTLWGPIGAWLLAFALAAGRAIAADQGMSVQALDLPMPRTLAPVQSLQVDTEPEWSPGGHRFEARWLATCPLGDPPPPCTGRQGRVQVEVQGKNVRVRPGDRLRVPAFTAPPPAYGNSGSRDVRTRWRRQGLVAQIHVGHPERLIVMPRPAPSPLQWPGGALAWLLHAIAVARRTATRQLLAAIPGPSGAILAALALGDRSGNDPDLQEWLQATGTAHVIAVSGSHLALMVLLVRHLARLGLDRLAPGWLRIAPRERWLAVPCIVAAWTYALLTGAASSTLRAAWMATAMLIGRAGGRQPGLVESLGLAICTLAIWDPVAVADVGFLLSVLGVLGLGWAGQDPAASLARPWLQRHLRLLLRASLGPSALTAPVVMVAFGALPLVGPLANLVVVPYIGVFMLPVALFATALALLPAAWTAVWLPGLADALLWPLRVMVQSPRGLWPMWWADGPRAWLIGLTAPVVLAAVWHGGRWRARAGLAIAVVVLACGWHAVANRVAPGTVRVTFLDVGHGDCTAIEFADGSTALVDAGGFVGDDGLVGRLAVVPWLRRAGFARIDRMVLSHAHPDHENGLLAVARRFDVGELWWNGQPAQGKEHKALLAALTAQGTQWRSFAPQDGGSRLITVGGVAIRVLSPQPARAPFASNLGLNDNSLVLELATGEHRMLLAGDIERTTEAALLEAGLLRPVDVLKVPHHGSRTSSTPAFLAAVRPGLAVAGARPWGALPFPHADILARYGKAGVPLWRTAGGMVALTLAPEGVRARQEARSWAIGP